MTIKKLILFSVLVLGAAWALGVRAYDIVLTPKYSYLGQLPGVEICEFSFNGGTILAPISRINPYPFVEQYGSESVVPAGSGGNCGPCWVTQISMDNTGTTTIKCAEGRTR